MNNQPPLIVHVIYRLSIGGLENGLVNLINHMPESSYRHAIVCLTDHTDFKQRIKRGDVQLYELNKKPGHDLSTYMKLWKLLRKLKPDIVHTRNLGTIEYVVPAWLAGIGKRVHGEHGRDMQDIDGTNHKYILLRRFCNLFIHRFVALSKDLEFWLLDTVGIPRDKITQLYNGVDLSRFSIVSTKPNQTNDHHRNNKLFTIGTVGRLQPEKDQATLMRACHHLLEIRPELKNAMKLVIVGDGPDRPDLEALGKELGINDQVSLLGARDDVPDLLNDFDVFLSALTRRGYF